MSTTSASKNSLTLRSLSASLLVVVLSGIVGQVSGVLDSANTLLGVEALPIPALLVVWPFVAALAGVAALSRARLLSKPELVVVTLVALLATPLMTVGFWRFQLAGLGTVVRASDFTKLQALPEGLWPHGANLLERALEPQARGVTRSVDGAGGRLRNGLDTDASALRLQLDLGAETATISPSARATVVPGRPYLFSARVKAERLGPDARYFVRVYADDSREMAAELVSLSAETKPSPLFPDGSTRVGYYPFELPTAARRSVSFELGLSGAGRVEWQDLQLYDVRALELAYKGYRRVTEDEYRSLSLSERQSAIVVPDQPFSGAGLRYLVGWDYPVRDWLAPIARLATFALLVFACTLGLCLLYRRQWLEHERFGAPLLRPLAVLLGGSEAQGGLGSNFWRNSWLWGGFGVAFVWCALRVLHGYVPSLPDLSVSIGLKSYLSDAFWGRTWDDVKLEVYSLFLGLGLLLDLKVLLSLVLGFLLCRLQYSAGQAYGLSSDYNFPHFPHQMLGAYLAYASCTVLLTRRYLADSVRRARSAGTERAALALLLGGALGFCVWARWVGIPLSAAALLAAHVVLLGFVAAKLRTECGLPRAGFNHPLGLLGNYNVPVEPLLLVPLLGGLSSFGGGGIMTMTLLTASVLPYGFFLVPGLQLEALELGRRFGVKTSQIALASVVAVVLGVVVGGWLYLTTIYGFGAAKLADASQFGDRLAAFRGFNSELASAKSQLPASAADQARYVALGVGALATAAVTLLRQWLPGFWFHPVGLLAGPSDMMQTLWGSLLVAWLVRLCVLRLGGAQSVREKLVPAAIGIFAASLCGHALYIVGNAYWFFFNKGSVKFTGLL
jgi:hypothetical protein